MPILSDRESAALGYVRRVSESPAGDLTEQDIGVLCNAGWDDGEILEINRVTAYFIYASRTVLGLGVNTAGDVLGLSPSGDGKQWQHQEKPFDFLGARWPKPTPAGSLQEAMTLPVSILCARHPRLG